MRTGAPSQHGRHGLPGGSSARTRFPLCSERCSGALAQERACRRARSVRPRARRERCEPQGRFDGEGLPRAVAHEVHMLISRLLHPIADVACSLWEEFATRELMTLSLPAGHSVSAETYRLHQVPLCIQPCWTRSSCRGRRSFSCNTAQTNPVPRVPPLSTGPRFQIGCGSCSTCFARVSATAHSWGNRSLPTNGWRYSRVRLCPDRSEPIPQPAPISLACEPV
jgi:hypothetical protein